MTINSYEKKLLILLLIVFILGSVLFGSAFFSWTTLAIIANQLPEYGLISLALFMTLIVSGMNLSIVAMTTLSGVLGGIVMERLSHLGVVSVVIGISVMIISGMLTGALNGVIVSYLEVSPILATLGTMLFYQGVAMNITQGGAITSFDTSFTVLGSGTIVGIPIPFVLFILVIGFMYWLLEKHEYGSQLYRIGKNAHSAVYSGIDVKKIVLIAYISAGVITGIAAVLMTARYNSIRVDYGASYLISGIVAVSLGGADIKGGKGSIKGVVVALLILSLLIRILNLANVDSSLIDGIMGLILLLNLSLHYYMDNSIKEK